MNIKITTTLDEKQPIPDDLFNKILKKGNATGSFIMGGYDENKSDIDFIILDDDNLFNLLKPYSVNSCDYDMNGVSFRPIYVRTKNNTLNLIFVKDQSNIDAWLTAQKLCVKLSAISYEYSKLMNNKEFRIKQFELLRNQFGWNKKKGLKDDIT